MNIDTKMRIKSTGEIGYVVKAVSYTHLTLPTKA